MMATSLTGSHQTPQRMTQNGIQIFRQAVKYIITEWPSLDLAIENGMGGPRAHEKRSWICDAIAEIVLSDKDIDLDEYLGEMINQEFDTLIEDGSLEYNVQWINKFYKDCLSGKENDVSESISQAAKKKLSLGDLKIPKPVCQTEESSSEDDGDENDETHE